MDRKLGRAFVVSGVVHSLVLVVMIWGAWHAARIVERETAKSEIVYFDRPGPNGGGGSGTPPAAPTPRMSRPTVSREVSMTPASAIEPLPIPSMNPTTPDVTDLIRAVGAGSVLLAGGPGPGGRGLNGSGDSDRPGAGRGDRGIGDGPFGLGDGIESPRPIKRVDPTYTAEAMQHKITGTVELNAIVEIDGTVTVSGVTKSLDKRFGLDQVAIDAAKTWRFLPGTKDGKPVRVYVTLIMEFRIH